MDLQDGTVVLDAYCGSGTIGIAAAAHARKQGVRIRLVGVERNVEGAVSYTHLDVYKRQRLTRMT